jgi:hypothetical protein
VAVRVAGRHVQRGVRGGAGAGYRCDPVDRQHGSGGRLHPRTEIGHHAAGRRDPLVHQLPFLVEAMLAAFIGVVLALLAC